LSFVKILAFWEIFQQDFAISHVFRNGKNSVLLSRFIISLNVSILPNSSVSENVKKC